MKQLIPTLFFFRLTIFFLFFLSACRNDDADRIILNPESKQPVGASARDLLSNDTFNNLEIEIVYIESNTAPDTDAIAALKTFIEARTFKTNVAINQRIITPPNQLSYSVSDLIEIEDTHRTKFNTADTVTVFIFYPNRPSSGDQGANAILGTAYRNTSFAMFKATINNISNQGNNPSSDIIETTVLQHEICHLLGLVDNGTPLQSDHSDSSSNSHCNVPNCLMLAALDFSDGVTGMVGVPDLDAQCIADLQANGGR
jgi:hypothetical protein